MKKVNQQQNEKNEPTTRARPAAARPPRGSPARPPRPPAPQQRRLTIKYISVSIYLSGSVYICCGLPAPVGLRLLALRLVTVCHQTDVFSLSTSIDRSVYIYLSTSIDPSTSIDLHLSIFLPSSNPRGVLALSERAGAAQIGAAAGARRATRAACRGAGWHAVWGAREGKARRGDGACKVRRGSCL